MKRFFGLIVLLYAVLAAAQTTTVNMQGTCTTNGVSSPCQITATININAIAVAVSPPSVELEVGDTQQFTATVSGGTSSDVNWKVSGTSGTISASGLFAATAAGDVTVTATSVQDPTKSSSSTVKVYPALAITSNYTPDTTVGADYPAYQYVATGGKTPYTWRVSAGTLPSGFSLSSSGLLTGKATTEGSYSWTNEVKDALAKVTTHGFGMVVKPSTVPPVTPVVSDEFNSTTLNTTLWTATPSGGTVSLNGTELVLNATTGGTHDPWTAGDTTVRVSQPVANVAWAVEAKFDSALAGSAEEGIIAHVDNTHFVRCNLQTSRTLQTRLFCAVVNGTTAATYLDKVLTTGGYPAPTWIRLQRSGSAYMFGYSTDGTNFQNTTFTDAVNLVPKDVSVFAGTSVVPPGFIGKVDYIRNIPVVIPPPAALVIPDQSPSPAYFGTPYNYQLYANGGVLPYSWAITGGALPPGLAMNATGLISGTPNNSTCPTPPCNYSFTVTVTDSAVPIANVQSLDMASSF